MKSLITNINSVSYTHLDVYKRQVALQHFGTMADILPVRAPTILFCCQDRSNVFISHLFLATVLCCPAVCQEIYSDGLNMFT